MKAEINTSSLETLIEDYLTTPSRNVAKGWISRLRRYIRRNYCFNEEMTTPSHHLSRTISSRTWRRHSALISCWEEQYKKSGS